MSIILIRRDRHIKKENWKRDQNTVKCELDLIKFWKLLGMTNVQQDRQPKIPLEMCDKNGNTTADDMIQKYLTDARKTCPHSSMIL